jgi:glucuronosyltransferase
MKHLICGFISKYVIGHPNVRVFVTHGGLMGTQEAVHTGVPMVGIPLFADQELNIRNYVSRGIAVMVLYDHVTKESISNALKTVLHDPR